MFGQVALIYSSPWLSFTGNPDREEASSFYIKSLSAKGIFRTSCSVKKKRRKLMKMWQIISTYLNKNLLISAKGFLLFLSAESS